MKQPKRRLDEQYQLAWAGGIEPPNGGIKKRKKKLSKKYYGTSRVLPKDEWRAAMRAP
jgi:hypothetical protein